MKILTSAKLSFIIAFIFVTNGFVAFAQNEKDQECNLKYSTWRSDVKSKNYEAAYEPWLWTFNNCPELSINIYKVGMEIVEYRYDKAVSETDKKVAADMVRNVYQQRLKYFPNENPAKMLTEWASFERKIGSPEPVYFELLQKAYTTNAEDMGVVAIPLYYQGIIDRNKTNDVQYIFDMYDNLNDVITKKSDIFSQQLDELQKLEDAGTELSDTQKRNKNAYTVNLEGLGQASSVLSDMSEEFATCDRLMPLYQAELDEHKTDIVWLRRSVGRLQEKGCTDSKFYDQLVELYVNADPTSDAFVKYAGILYSQGDENKALEYFKKAVDLETENYKKANILLNIASIMKDKGRLAEARSYANRAIEARPSLGKAYLLIAQMYAASASSCGGGDPFGVRMVYQLAADKAARAKSVDPSITTLANRYYASYKAKAPTKEEVFVKGLSSGASWSINCWIGESTRIP